MPNHAYGAFYGSENRNSSSNGAKKSRNGNLAIGNGNLTPRRRLKTIARPSRTRGGIAGALGSIFGGGNKAQGGLVECNCPSIDGTQVICGYKHSQAACNRCCRQSVRGRKGNGKPSGGSMKVGPNHTQWPCSCTDSAGNQDGFQDLSVGAGNLRQAGRRCEKRGNAQGRSCTAWGGGGQLGGLK